MFDTVGSFGSAGDDINFKPRDPSKHQEHEYTTLGRAGGILTLDGTSWRNAFTLNGPDSSDFEEYNFNLHLQSAQKIVHLIALNEYRKNFPLTNIRAAGWEYALLGVHSDIGGGYRPQTSEYASFSPRRYYSRHNRDEALADASHQQSLLSDGWRCKVRSRGRNGYSIHCEQTRIVTDDLQKVGLSVMHYQSRVVDVPFEEITGIDIQLPAVLEPYRDQAVQSPSTAKDYAEKEIILSQYAHHSAVDTEELYHHRDSVGFAETALGSNDMQYKDGLPHRTVFDNKASKAVLNTD